MIDIKNLKIGDCIIMYDGSFIYKVIDITLTDIKVEHIKKIKLEDQILPADTISNDRLIKHFRMLTSIEKVKYL